MGRPTRAERDSPGECRHDLIIIGHEHYLKWRTWRRGLWGRYRVTDKFLLELVELTPDEKEAERFVAVYGAMAGGGVEEEEASTTP
jgi:hypothetical protein